MQNQKKQPLKSPGMLKKHYAPRAKLLLWRRDNAQEWRDRIAALGEDPARVHILAQGIIPEVAALGQVTVMPGDPIAFARVLYSQLHRCDAAEARYIVMEMPPETDAWRAIADRLKRAAAS
jgi:L-threonylcarbamoyladenylate synthase